MVNAGNATCPCINVTDVLATATAVSKLTGQPPPLGYGSNECRAWRSDRSHGRCSGSSWPKWCNEDWCYVDTSTCYGSEFYYQASDEFPALRTQLFYSVATCSGTVSQQSSFPGFLSSMQGLDELRVVIPPAWYPYHYKVVNGTWYKGSDRAILNNPSIPWQGALIRFLTDALQNAPFGNITYSSVSGGAMSVNPTSAWDAATLDVGSGVVDLGLSIFWVSSQRVEVAAFTTPLSQQSMYLWVPRPSKDADTESFFELAVQ